jgi:phosphoribosylformylglycinamidine cyclo-ligase
MPDLYQGDDLDLAGCIIGVVEKEKIIDGSTVVPGDRVIGLASNGLHTNGYSLARKIVFDEMGLNVDDHVEKLGCTVGEALLRVHVSYLSAFSRIEEVARVKALAHITGGGIRDNLSRVLPRTCDARIEKGTWPVLPLFDFLREGGDVEEPEMYQVFNMGLGMLLVVSAADEKRVISSLEGRIDAYPVGRIVEGRGAVSLV